MNSHSIRFRLQLGLHYLVGIFALLAAMSSPALANSRIKDIADFENIRTNQLVGYGLVVGLAGTGDKIRNAPFTEESMKGMLERMGINVRGADMKVQNVAAVVVTATMPAFARPGSRVDVLVSAIGDASSLQGGMLIVSSLRGLDGEVYAVAQGPIAVSGFKAQGAGASIIRGVATHGHIAEGGIIEREVAFRLNSMDVLNLALRNPDFTTARHVAEAINRAIPNAAEMLDPGTVQIKANGQAMAQLLSRIENLEVQVDQLARVIIDESSGTIVMGQNVRISPVAIAQGALTITVSENSVVSQPNPLSTGETVVLPATQITVDDGQGKKLAVLDEGVSLRSLVKGLNALGVSPRDLITIFQAIKAAGALQAEVVVQ
ncbi:flagellar basal body P-ring protein FlgI [Sphingorhabdus sp. EL138]|uniref:flagellar basal body P-ring protein FlgI n=1 Tax=Sphingorhabdus sp. EL138 TaxID=2073156 RepID=UPI0025D04444|nr:flagellar basal body P-ring protein FlgI [Sphingorhabdus sp. EL138]